MNDGKSSEPPATDVGSSLFLSENTLLELPRQILKLIIHPAYSEHLTRDDLPERIGIKMSRVKAILSPKAQGTKRLSLDEISQVVTFARSFAKSLKDARYREHIVGDCNALTTCIHTRLEEGGLSPTEHAFATNLRLDDHHQQAFSNRHAGVYALIRLDRDADILISRMDIFPREARICRFATDSRSPGLYEPTVQGYIYAVGDEIQAVGRPASESPLRTSILRSRHQPGSANDADMIGLRLGISDYDGGPFAYRIYCRRIAGPERIGNELPAWKSLFVGRKHQAGDKITPMISDIADILKLLREPDNGRPWGVRIPTGIEP